MISKHIMLYILGALVFGSHMTVACAGDDDASLHVAVSSPVLAELFRNLKKLEHQAKPLAVAYGSIIAGSVVYAAWRLNSFLSRRFGCLTKKCIYHPCLWLKNKIWGNDESRVEAPAENSTEQIVGKVAEWSSFIALWLLQGYILKGQYDQARRTIGEISDEVQILMPQFRNGVSFSVQ